MWEGHKILRNLHLLSNVVAVKSMVKILQNFVAFSEYMNFMNIYQKLYIASSEMGPFHYMNPTPFSYKTTFIKNASKGFVSRWNLVNLFLLKLNQLWKQKGENFFFTDTRTYFHISTSMLILFRVSNNLLYMSRLVYVIG